MISNPLCCAIGQGINKKFRQFPRVDYICPPLAASIVFCTSTSKCPRGEIGRHAILRGWCSKGRAGSNPVVGTKGDFPHIEWKSPFFIPFKFPENKEIALKISLTRKVRTSFFWKSYSIPSGEHHILYVQFGFQIT